MDNLNNVLLTTFLCLDRGSALLSMVLLLSKQLVYVCTIIFFCARVWNSPFLQVDFLHASFTVLAVAYCNSLLLAVFMRMLCFVPLLMSYISLVN